MQAAGALPRTVAELLRHTDGLLPFYDFVGLSAAGMEEVLYPLLLLSLELSDTKIYEP